MQGHELRVALLQGCFVATCECSQWRHEYPIQANQSISVMLQRLKQEHAKHVDAVGDRH